MSLDPVQLNLFSNRVAAICDEMGIVLRRTAFSPNIKDRLDYSCALFGPKGELFAQAAHIPVHLGSMAYAMSDLVNSVQWQSGDLLAVNDPYKGGTHLPDVTLISPVIDADSQVLMGFVANRAHHANIGCDTPGSMPVSKSLEEEGVIIPPTLIVRGGQLQEGAELLPDVTTELIGDFAAQAGANKVGARRLEELIDKVGITHYIQAMAQLNDYADRLMGSAIKGLKNGVYEFSDLLDDDGQGTEKIELALRLTVNDSAIELDFSESSEQVPGNLNCPEAVVAAASYYCFRCLIASEAPACEGLFRRIKLLTKKGSIVNAERPAAVAAGNVETSTRLVDLVFGALAQALPERIPAASQGTMNNVAMGNIDSHSGERWDYYETLAGGHGAGPLSDGLNCAHSHMTNTLNTPIESLEMNYPLRVLHYGIRKGSGGSGLHCGGEGISREYEFLENATLSLLTERRATAPWGLEGGGKGMSGKNWLNGEEIDGKITSTVKAKDRLRVDTPGGGGWGEE